MKATSRVRLAFGVALAAALVSFARPAMTSGAPRQGSPTRSPAKPLPAPPTLPLIRLEVTHDHVLVIEDVALGRGAWTSGDFDAFVAFGAPGVPRAIDARLASFDDADAALAPESFEPVPVERAYSRPSGARLLLGGSSMAGAVLHVRDAAFRRATARTGRARLRVRTLLDTPSSDVRTGREVVIRLGTFNGEPYALGDIEIASNDAKPWLTEAEARLCGPDADRYPLAVRVIGKVGPSSRSAASRSDRSPVAPILSVRHPTDELCIRFWTS